jgi:hypothetical protein
MSLYESQSHSIPQTLWLLANNPTSQEKLRKEVTELLEKSPTPDYRSLKDCQMLDCVMWVRV